MGLAKGIAQKWGNEPVSAACDQQGKLHKCGAEDCFIGRGDNHTTFFPGKVYKVHVIP